MVVLEARERSGGRVLTVRSPFDDGLHAEAGPIRIAGVHQAVLRAARSFGLTLTPFESSQGSPVVAIGNPAGAGLRVTVGYVSGIGRAFRGPRGRRVAGAVEHTAPLLPGSSGGPIVDGDGKLLGINTNRLGSGFYQAIASEAGLRDRVAALGRGEEPKKRRLGLGLAPAHVARQLRRAVGLDERDGLLVRDVEDGSPAAKAGIAEGDLIVAAAGKPVASADDLFEAMGTIAADAALPLTVLRGAEERTVTVAA